MSSGRASRSVTLADVAAAAGVAPMTVSRVINAPDRVAADTAARVQSAITRLGYVPNLVAGGLSSQRSRMVAAVVPTISHPMFATVIDRFTTTLREAGYQVMLSLTGYGASDPEQALVRGLLGRRPDGILVTGLSHSPVTRRLLARAGIPVVEIFDAGPRPIDALVGFSHAGTGALAAEHFLARGHTRFAMFAAGDARARERRRGFIERVKAERGAVLAAPVLPAPSTILAGRAAMQALLPQLDRPAALFCSSDLLAFGAIVEARRHGIAVPAHLAVCGFGDFELSAASDPAFTTITVEAERIGEASAAILLNRFGGRPAPKRIEVPVRILERGSG